ncbi:terminase small subunit protein [Mesorhizobium sp.]|uniref:terminase small subunit-like protein n=1 Tax=Mesorhizobium sp. TaxID=1871066 RepID=UPI0025C652E2|nr:terminase small subunit protein [Mesorhizobium sp.]
MPRSSEYSDEIAARICEELIEGKSLRKICEAEDMPAASTVFLWLSRFPTFSEQYTRAREAQMEAMADDIVDIADDGTNDYVTKTNGDGSTYEAFDSEHVQRSKLRVDTRKWLMGKLAPKKYGDKLDLNVGGSLQTMPQEDLDARIAKLLAEAGAGATAGGEGKTQGEK